MREPGEEFSETQIEQLRELWAEGHSAAEIGRRMNRSKNSIVGKAHRLKLPGRPSPLNNGVNTKITPEVLAQAIKMRTQGHSVQTIRGFFDNQFSTGHLEHCLRDAGCYALRRLPAIIKRPFAPKREPQPQRRSRLPESLVGLVGVADPGDGCKFPLSDDKPWTFCGRPRAGRDYCVDHHRICHPAVATEAA